ncbi:MAG: bifunctional aldolase/short-chain dehydrogenase [Desulfobacterales bacterium]|nr:bifunctional aldolase/short-chain dehydrogenase [Desulfobacterales bacterium]
MKTNYNNTEAKEFIQKYPDVPEELALRVYTSQLIGKDPNLVLHGGGNTSVKLKMTNILGDEQDILYVKGSGQDMETIEPQGFTGLDLNYIQRFRTLQTLTDEDMENQLKIRKIDPDSPDPSVEAILHAFLPHKYIDHTHADSILILTNQKNGQELIKQALGPKVAVTPYIKSGFPLATGVAESFENTPDAEAIVVLNHGIFTFGNDAKTSYERMIDYVSRAEAYINLKLETQNLKLELSGSGSAISDSDFNKKAARLVQAVRGACAHHGHDGKLRRFYTEIRTTPDIIEASLSKNAREICRSGVLTPDHAIRTKNQTLYIEQIPENDGDLAKLVNESVDAYRTEYDQYFENHVKSQGIDKKKLDPFPRTLLVPGIGIIALGFTRKAARIAADIAEHTIKAKYISTAVGDYEPIPESHVFDMEYWSLQQKKLGKADIPPLQGQTALVTGAGGAIGFGIADRLMNAGAVVVLADIDEQRLETVRSILAQRYGKTQAETIVFDVTQYDAVEKAYEQVSLKTGGIDIVVPNAGLAHVAKIEALEPEKFSQLISVNLTGTFNVIKASIPVYKRQGTGGNIVLISTINVFKPGAAFGAYSASKAGAHQMAKIAALEMAELGVRVNMINPDAVFGDEAVSSKLWDVVGPDRMKSRGLDPEGLKEYYRQRNLLKASVFAEHVGNAVVFFASDLTPTTGATIPVDGGVSEAFPR